MKELTTIEQVDELLAKDKAIILKHSTQCPISAAAYEEVEEFEKETGKEVNVVKVIEDRPVSNYIQEKTNIQHESPQIIFLENGKPTFNTSHREITAELMKEK